jgi:hypothetical protein
MPSKAREKAVASLTDKKFDGSELILGRVAFMLRMNELLKAMEKAAPHKNARELEERIRLGTAKIDAARRSSKAPADKLAEAEAILAGLKAEVRALYVDYIVPHHVLHMIHYLLDHNDRTAWPISAPGVISVKLPGVLSVSVEVPTDLPF